MLVSQRPDVVVRTALIGRACVPIVAPPAALDGRRRKRGIDSVEVSYRDKIDVIVLVGRTYRLGIFVAAKRQPFGSLRDFGTEISQGKVIETWLLMFQRFERGDSCIVAVGLNRKPPNVLERRQRSSDSVHVGFYAFFAVSDCADDED